MRGATFTIVMWLMPFLISIHAPHAGSDYLFFFYLSCHLFQSTLPMRGAKGLMENRYKRIQFQSTLPMRGASGQRQCGKDKRDFNPRSPCGERHQSIARTAQTGNFNPRSPCGERISIQLVIFKGIISIHAPHAGSERLPLILKILIKISIHAPHAGSDPLMDSLLTRQIFQSTLPMRGAR